MGFWRIMAHLGMFLVLIWFHYVTIQCSVVNHHKEDNSIHGKWIHTLMFFFFFFTPPPFPLNFSFTGPKNDCHIRALYNGLPVWVFVQLTLIAHFLWLILMFIKYLLYSRIVRIDVPELQTAWLGQYSLPYMATCHYLWTVNSIIT